MGNKTMFKNRYIFTVTVFVILLFSINLIIYFYLQRKKESISKYYNISRMQVDYINNEEIEFLSFFKISIPLSKDQYQIHPNFINGELKSIEIKSKKMKKSNILIEISKIRELMFNELSVAKWLFIREYRQANYNEFKKNILFADKCDYSWWNLYGNLKLLLYIAEKKKSLPEGLTGIFLLIFKDYEGYLEEYKIENGNTYYGYNFVVGNTCYNIILTGYSNISEVMMFLKGIKISQVAR